VRYNDQTPAVVVGGGINGLGVVRSLGAGGVPVHVLDADHRAPAMRSRFARAHKAPIIGVEDSLLGALNRLPHRLRGSRPVVLLTTENAVIDAMNDYATLAQRFRLTLAAPDVLQPALHKNSMRDIARRAGLRVPPTAHVTRMPDLQTLANWPMPWIIKPAHRDAAYSRQFDKAYRVDDAAHAATLIQAMLEVSKDLIVQQWIEGADSDLYFCLQYRPQAGGRTESFVGRKLRSWPPLVGGTASCTQAEGADHLVKSTDAFFQEAGIWGLAGMEYKRDKRTGEYVVVEPTVGRTDFQAEVATLHGVNIPLAAYHDAAGAPPPTVPNARDGKPRVWREHMSDTSSALASGLSLDSNPGQAKAVDALFRWNDPGPAAGALIDRIGRRLLKARRFHS